MKHRIRSRFLGHSFKSFGPHLLKQELGLIRRGISKNLTRTLLLGVHLETSLQTALATRIHKIEKDVSETFRILQKPMFVADTDEGNLDTIYEFFRMKRAAAIANGDLIYDQWLLRLFEELSQFRSR